MNISFAEPHPKLRPYIALYYLFEEDSALIDDGQRADTSHLRLFLSGKGAQYFASGNRIESGSAMLVGHQSTASRFYVQGPLRFLGVSLMPHAWGGGLLPVDAHTLLDNGMDAGIFFDNAHIDLIEAMKLRSSIVDMAPLADAFFLSRIKPLPNDHAQVIDHIKDWLKSELFPDVDALYSVCAQGHEGLGQRQVMRIANRYWGQPPKGLMRKYAALRTASHIMNEGVPCQAALDYYSDHSHLIREVKRVTGMTPRQLNTITNIILRMTLDPAHYRELDRIL
jgi:hypothetical protein